MSNWWETAQFQEEETPWWEEMMTPANDPVAEPTVNGGYQRQIVDFAKNSIIDQLIGGGYEFLSREKGASAVEQAQSLADVEAGGPAETLNRDRFGISSYLKTNTPERKEQYLEDSRESIQNLLNESADLAAKGQAVPFSQETRDFIEENSDVPIWEAFKKAPAKIITELGARSGLAMVPGLTLGAAAGSVAGPGGFALGMGAGSARVEYAASLLDGLQEAGVDLTSADAIVEAVKDKDLMHEVERRATIRSAVIGGFDGLAGLLGAKQLTPGIKNAVTRELANAGIQMPAQAGLGAAGEFAGEYAATGEVHPREIAAEAVGEFVTAPIDIATAGLSGAREQSNQWTPEAPTSGLMEAPEQIPPASPTNGALPTFDEAYNQAERDIQSSFDSNVQPVIPPTEQANIGQLYEQLNQTFPVEPAPVETMPVNQPLVQNMPVEPVETAFPAPADRITQPTATPSPVLEETPLQDATGALTQPEPTLSVTWGNQSFPVASIEDAQAMWNQFRTETGAGASEIGSAKVVDSNGTDVGKIAYNGRFIPAKNPAPTITQQENAPVPSVPEVGSVQQSPVSNNIGQAENVDTVGQPTADVAGVGEVGPNVQTTVDYLNRRGIEAVDPTTLNVDAKTFQFKSGSDEKGVLDTLKSVKQWDDSKAGTAMVYEYADGRRFVADGHQRVALAKRLTEQGRAKDVRVLAHVLRETDGHSPADAKVLAAEVNIAQGTGTAVDAAKVLREIPDPQERSDRLEKMPVGNAMVRDAIGLSKLSETAFMNVVNEQVSPAAGALVGNRFESPAEQEAAMQVLIDNKPASADQARVMLEDIAAAGFSETDQGGLFGDSALESVIKERSKILANAVSGARKDKNLFARLVENEKQINSTGANRLDAGSNAKALSDNQALADTLIRSINTTPELNGKLNELAAQLKQGRISQKAATRQFLDQARAFVATGGVFGRVGQDVEGSVGAGQEGAEELTTPQDPNDSLFSRNRDSEKSGLSAPEVQSTVGKIRGLKPGQFKVVQSESDLPNRSRLQRLMTVYHGSPHKWDRVDLSKVGTGEGVQAYGHGFYAAENKGVAEDYKKNLSHKYPISHSGVIEENGKFLAWAKNIDKENVEIIHTANTKGEAQKKLKEYLNGNRGNLYELDLPDSAIEKMLDWDKPLSEQPESVRKALDTAMQNAGISIDPQTGSLVDKWYRRHPNPTGKDVYFAIAENNPEYINQMPSFGEKLKDSRQMASEYLNSLGIPGIKYLDGTSRNKGEGTRNYVVFNENNVKVISRNGERLSANEGAIEGMFDPATGEIYLVADNISSPERAAWVAWHEQWHRGGRVSYGEQFSEKLDEAGKNTFVSRLANAILRDRPNDPAMSGPNARRVAVEEALAELNAAQRTGDYAGIQERYKLDVPTAQQATWRGVVARFYEWLTKVFRNITGSNVSNADVFRIVRGADMKADAQAYRDSVEEGLDAEPAMASRAPKQTQSQDFSNFTLPTRKLAETMKDDSLKLIDRALKGTENIRLTARQKIQDKMIPIRRLQEAVEKSGVTVSEFADVYAKEQLLSGRVEYNFHKMEHDDLAPLVALMNRHGVSRETLGKYLYARHAQARNERVAEVNENFPDGGSGMTTEEAQKILRDFRKEGLHQPLSEMAAIVDRITAKTRQHYREYGLVDEGVIDAWEEDNDFNSTYVPLRGFADSVEEEFGRPGRGFDIRGDETKRALGRKSEPGDIIGHVLSAYKLSVIRGEKNRVGQSLLKLAVDNPNPNLWEINPVETKTVIDPKTGMTTERTNAVLNDPNVFYTKVNGQSWRIELKDKRMSVAMKNLGADNMGALIRGLSATTRYLSLTRTMLSPEFIVTNFMRDIQTAGINLDGEQGKAIRKAAINRKAITHSIRAMFNEQRDGAKGDPEWRKYAKEYTEDGGRVAFFRAESVEELARKVDRMNRMSGKDPMAVGYRGLKATFDLIEDMNLAVENAVRLAAYKAARENGVSRQNAAVIAKNLTVNFNRRGTAGPGINALYMFANASIQGAQRTLQAAKNPRVQKVLMASAGFAALMTIYNELAGGEDDDGESYYSKIPDFEKGRKLIFMIPDGLNDWVRDLPFMNFADEDRKRGAYLTIHLPYGYSVPYAMGEAIASTGFGTEPSEAALKIIQAINNSFNPVGSSDLATTFAPTLADPFVELWRNTNYFGGPIHRGENPWDNTPAPKSGEGWTNTAAPYKYVAEKLNEWSGGNAVRPGWFDYHPETYRHFFEFATGGTGSFFERVTDNVTAAINPDREVDVNRIPFLRSFFGTTRDFTDRDRYSAHIKELGYLKDEQKYLREQVKKGEIDSGRYDEWVEDHQDVLSAGLIGRAADTDKAIRKLYKARKEALERGDSERVAKLEDDILRHQIQFNTRYNEIMLDRGWIRSFIDSQNATQPDK